MMVTSSLISATDQQQLKQITTSQITSKVSPLCTTTAMSSSSKNNLPVSTGKIIAGISSQVIRVH